ncbi:hypothetical protein AZE42_09400 [Rhizopogon vesiculosus]|uniref:Uncharacterized protein n=1 Tax=Rhizopogon vesiculosus TaxID=180088 RepID=A0A1J8RHT4_9AGAM|nr:hypothetical protein AZE42_09400 [Rhizopogon vesiculosus]
MTSYPDDFNHIDRPHIISVNGDEYNSSDEEDEFAPVPEDLIQDPMTGRQTDKEPRNIKADKYEADKDKQATCTTLVHKTETTTVSKHANKERKHVDTEKLKVNVNDTEAKKTPPVRTPSLSEVVHPPPDPAIMTVAPGPDSKAPEKKASPTPINHLPADSEVIPQAQDTGSVVNEPEAKESRCPGIHTHPPCENCFRMPATGVKHNRYPKCTIHRWRKDDSRLYIDGYTD